MKTRAGSFKQKKWLGWGVFSCASFVLAAFLAGGCSMPGKKSVAHQPSKSVIIGEVPFFPQSRYQCGPASLAGVLKFYGDEIRPEEIADVIYRGNIRGTVSLDLALYPRQRGFASHWYNGSAEDLKRKVDQGAPLVVMVDRGLSRIRAHHFMVVTGYDSEGAIVNSGKSQGKVISWDLFLSQWQRTRNWTLLIAPEKVPGTFNQQR
jgi:ABC-type bacteriocin/lantibiotic exporter with double-glycine peptidase domain